MVKLLTKESLAVRREPRGFKPGVKLSEHFRPAQVDGNGRFVMEIVQPEDFGAAWTTRQRYEIDAGRDEEPILYEPLYNTIRDENFGSSVSMNFIGPGGVVFNALLPGGETRFASIGSSSQVVPMVDYTVGLEYSERMFVYNEFWGLEIFERQAGIASNALLNHLHLFPFLDATYGPNNQTAASTIGGNLEQKYMHTIEDAIASAQSDTTNRRNGPYYLLVSPTNFPTVRRAVLGNMPGGGVDMTSNLGNDIQGIISYNGWSGEMAGETTVYPGVTAGKAYLISVNGALKMRYALSLIKFLLRNLRGNPDVSRLVAQQEVLWNSVGLYVNPLALAEEITLPIS